MSSGREPLSQHLSHKAYEGRNGTDLSTNSEGRNGTDLNQQQPYRSEEAEGGMGPTLHPAA